MWIYVQRTGEIRLNGSPFALAYAGWDDGDGLIEPGEGRNDPSMQGVRSVGPLPVGRYSIGLPFTHPTAGPMTLRLEPLPGTDTLGRSGFLIHGDNANRSASHGCIVAPLPVRREIASRVVDGDRVLEVVAEAPTTQEGTA
jgi:hypothetical protein